MVCEILCIEDEPEELFGNATLYQWLDKLFGKRYGFLLEQDPEKAYDLLHESPDIKVVLLDIEFSGEPLGSEIADTIYRMRPDIKIIVLTIKDHKGARISLRQKKNVWEYFVKMDMEHAQGRVGLYNIAKGLIEDPYNMNWRIRLVPEDRKMVLSNPVIDIVEEISFRNIDDINTVASCLEHPGKCINIIDIEKSSDYQLAKIVSRVNSRIRDALGWRTWGILDSKRCADNELRVLIGSEQVNGDEDKFTVLLTELAEVKSRLENLERKLLLPEQVGRSKK